ncbi:MAG: S8 family serine peptidase, partial [Bryobacteraceae bacterium]
MRCFSTRKPALTVLVLGLLTLISPLWPLSPGAAEWIILLDEAPALARFPGRYESTHAVADAYRQHLREVQALVRARIESRNMHVTGALQHVLNAMLVKATLAQAQELRGVPGIKAVLRARPFRTSDQLSLSHVQTAWTYSAIGGQSNAGAGLKIGIIDSGIDQTHPAFQDDSLTIPAGFPKCNAQSDCDQFTNKKVIVARSYVSMSAAGSNPSDPAADSRPDDYSARDLGGHGTAVASVAAGVP